MNYAIILAGGKGTRFGNKEIPKQFIELTSVPMLVYSMRTAQKNPNIDAICVVAAPAMHKQVRCWAAEYGITKLWRKREKKDIILFITVCVRFRPGGMILS